MCVRICRCSGMYAAARLLLFAVALTIVAWGGAAAQRTTILHKITVNGKPPGRLDITLARADSITFEFRCKIDSAVEAVPFLFSTSLRAEQLAQRQQQTLGATSVTYTGLPEDRYVFAVQAMLPGQWQALPTSIEFAVNDSVAAAQRREEAVAELARMQQHKADSAAAHSAVAGGMSPALLGGAAAGILLAAAGIFAAVGRRKKRRAGRLHAAQPVESAGRRPTAVKRKKTDKTSDIASSRSTHKGNNMQPETPELRPAELRTENETLRKEIAALRGQIDNLQKRGDELYRQNKSLEETVQRIESKRLELEEIHAQKDELFAMVIHDIKNPATVVKGLVELLNSYDLNANEQQDVMNDLMETSKKIISLSQEVCKVMALEAGHVRLNYEPVDIAMLVNDVCRRNDVNAKAKSIGLSVEIVPGIPTVELDPQRIEEVIDNLVSNAVKFSNNGSGVRVRARREAENLVVEVSDNGVGMTEEDIKRAFNRGAKLSARPTAGEPSSGLGLWIVKRMVEDHKGRVWVRSAIGRGSTFAFQIPLVRPAGQ